jgi:hypothetical protein
MSETNEKKTKPPRPHPADAVLGSMIRSLGRGNEERAATEREPKRFRKGDGIDESCTVEDGAD